jgi:ribosome-associated protein
MDDDLVVAAECRIPASELEWRFSASGGPGGQHANRSNTKAEVRFDVAASGALTDSQRTRIRSKLGEVVIVAADDERSQARNRQLALDRLSDRLETALHRPKRRRPTRPSRGAKQRRLDQKKQRSQTKKHRQKPSSWD